MQLGLLKFPSSGHGFGVMKATASSQNGCSFGGVMSSSPVVEARIGRQHQRYLEKYRLVAGCIPYKLKEFKEDCSTDLESRLEVLMISTPNRSDLIFPKGGWEDDETECEAAKREALEEAGVIGEIHEERKIGEWVFRSKSSQNSCTQKSACKGVMFAMKVTEELDSWPEKACHDRIWLSVRKAYELCRYDWMREALDMFVTLLLKEEEESLKREAAVMPNVSEKSEHSILPTNCFMKPSEAKCLDSPISSLC
ncbi:hypothetical protein QJS10_CPB04g00069 [Acorus calamus]|uniref:Nudix hydrolase domain-containing protein n=1 Tax=Acorus calamus TaxID=4465 RepID=A0AAV9F0U8_ACOCL|nr:hypothetical protein QJS10_CPB04g00069 [Acorus calamus]